MKLDLAIAIPVRNEEKNLAGCLDAIGKDFAREIIVIDSGSTDRTKEIALEFGATVIDFTWNGRFPKKRNWFLQNHKPSTKWVLFLDADEYLTESFKNEMRSTLKSSDSVGFWLCYTIYFMGKRMKGGYPLKKLALFCVEAGEYEHIDENNWSNLDMEVHEHPILSGKIGTIKNKIDHRDFKGVTNYIEKHTEYASWEAARFLNIIQREKTSSSWTWKQKVKYALLRSIWAGPIYFFFSFFILGGFRDGKRGLAFAIFKMSYFTNVHALISEKQISLMKEEIDSIVQNKL